MVRPWASTGRSQGPTGRGPPGRWWYFAGTRRPLAGPKRVRVPSLKHTMCSIMCSSSPRASSSIPTSPGLVAPPGTFCAQRRHGMSPWAISDLVWEGQKGPTSSQPLSRDEQVITHVGSVLFYSIPAPAASLDTSF